jgi:hypothetical protein
MRGAPGQAVLGGDLGHCPVRLGDRLSQPLAQPAGRRDRGGISALTCVNDARGQAGSRQARRRLRHHSATCWFATGRSRMRASGRSFTRLLAVRIRGRSLASQRLRRASLGPPKDDLYLHSVSAENGARARMWPSRRP